MKTMRVMGGVTCRLQESTASLESERRERSRALDARTGTVHRYTRRPPCERHSRGPKNHAPFNPHKNPHITGLEVLTIAITSDCNLHGLVILAER